jgi:hypothetical protein
VHPTPTGCDLDLSLTISAAISCPVCLLVLSLDEQLAASGKLAIYPRYAGVQDRNDAQQRRASGINVAYGNVFGTYGNVYEH